MEECWVRQLQVVVPVWHDNRALDELLTCLNQWRLHVWVVDGAADPATAALVRKRGNYLAADVASRGAQIRQGIAAGDRPWIWVLHADTQVTAAAVDHLAGIVRAGRPCWGRYDVALPGLGLIAGFMNWRSRLTHICTGDQGMFFHRTLLDRIGGFPGQRLMEDIEVSKRLKRCTGAQFRAPRCAVRMSSRRWRQHGVVRTVLTMWWYRWRYLCGTSADDLYRAYYGQQP